MATTYLLLLVLSAGIQKVVSCLHEILVDDTATTRPQTYPLVLSLGQNLDNCFRVVASDTNKYLHQPVRLTIVNPAVFGKYSISSGYYIPDVPVNFGYSWDTDADAGIHYCSVVGDTITFNEFPTVDNGEKEVMVVITAELLSEDDTCNSSVYGKMGVGVPLETSEPSSGDEESLLCLHTVLAHDKQSAPSNALYRFRPK